MSRENTLKKLEKEFITAKALANISGLGLVMEHHLKTPLAIMGFSLRNLSNLTNDERILREVEKIRRQKDMISHTVSELGILYRAVTNPEVRARIAKINLKPVIENTVKYVTEFYKEKLKNIKIEVIAEEDIEVNIGEISIHFIIENLVLNAIDAINFKNEANGLIRIEGKKDKKDILISVSDNGCGIRVDDLSRVFEPFFTTRKKEGSTGLGLFVVKNIVKINKGDIFVKSKLNEGTTFQIKLPKLEGL